MGGKAHLKLWVKLRCSLRYAQLLPKWHLAGQLAETGFSNVHARWDVLKCFHFRWERIWVDSAC